MDLSGLICPWTTILLWQLRARTKCGFPWISWDFPSECNELGLILARVGTFLKGTPTNIPHQCGNLTFEPCVCADICVWAARNLPERYTHHWENLTFEPYVCADICVWAAWNLPERYTHHWENLTFEPYVCADICVWAAWNLPERYTHHWENLTFEPCVCADICVWAARNLPERYTLSVWKPYFRALRLCRLLCVGR